MAKYEFGNVRPDYHLDVDNEDQLKSLYLAYFPAGSGPLGSLSMICKLIETIAEEKGYNIMEWKDGN